MLTEGKYRTQFKDTSGYAGGIHWGLVIVFVGLTSVWAAVTYLIMEIVL